MTVTADQRESPFPDTASPLVSVIVPVYNSAESLNTAVRSVLRQSLSNFEVVIVDDGSSDDSLRVAAQMAAEDSRINVFRHPRNRGQSAARNLALEHARGRWIALLDADDEIAEQRLERLCHMGEAQKADLVADGVRFAGPRQPGTPERLRPCQAINGCTQTLSLQALLESDIPLNGMVSFGYLKPIIRRAFLNRWQLRYDETLRFAEDLNLYVKALMCGGRFVLHPHSFYVYNQTPVSASRAMHRLPNMADHALVNNQRMRELARQCGIGGLDALLDEHEQRWSTVLWFNRLKLAVRNGSLTDAMRLTLDCPSGPRGVLRFARDRVRMKRACARQTPTSCPPGPAIGTKLD